MLNGDTSSHIMRLLSHNMNKKQSRFVLIAFEEFQVFVKVGLELDIVAEDEFLEILEKLIELYF